MTGTGHVPIVTGPTGKPRLSRNVAVENTQRPHGPPRRISMKRMRPASGFPSKEELATDQVLGAIRSCAQRLYTAAWSCDSLAPTVTGFVADLRSGYSTYDLPPEELREAAFAAGELTAIAALNGWSIAEALEKVSVRDELFYIHQTAQAASAQRRTQ